MRKHRPRPRPTGADQDKARTIAKFLRDEGIDVLTQDNGTTQPTSRTS